MGTRTENLDLIIRARETAQTKAALGDISKMITGIGTTLLAYFGGKQVFDSVILGSAKLQSEMVDLSAAVRRAGIDWKLSAPEIDKFTTSMESQKGLVDDYVRQTLPLALDYTKNLGDAETIVSAAADLAAAKHIDLETAVNLLGKAYLGHTETLVRYGIEIKDTSKALGDANYIQSQIDERFKNSSSDAAEKLTTKWKLLADSIGDVAEAIGNKIGVGGSGGPLTSLTAAFKDLAEFIDRPRQSLMRLYATAEAAQGNFEEAQKWVAKLNREFAAEAGLSVDLYNKGVRLGESLHWVATKAEMASGAFGKFSEQEKKAADQLPKLFEDPNFIKIEDWWAATTELKTMAKEVYTAWLDTYYTTGNAAEDEANRAVEMYGEEGTVTTAHITAAAVVQSAWKQSFDRAAKEMIEFENASQVVANAFSGAFRRAASGAVNYIMGQWKFLQEESKNIWQAMAKDFITYFIDEMLKWLAAKAVAGILKILGSLFDTPANDRMAQRQGRDFSYHFVNGARDYLTGNMNVGNWMSSNFQQYFGQQYTGPLSANGIARGNSGVTVIIQGSILGTEQFVRDTLVPAIQKASNAGFGKISTDNSFRTGREVIAYS
jgi:hypothetical protein